MSNIENSPSPKALAHPSPFWLVIGCFCVLSILGCGPPDYSGPPKSEPIFLLGLLPFGLSILAWFDIGPPDSPRWKDQVKKRKIRLASYVALFALAFVLSAVLLIQGAFRHQVIAGFAGFCVFVNACGFFATCVHAFGISEETGPRIRNSLKWYGSVTILTSIAALLLLSTPKDHALGGSHYPVGSVSDLRQMPWYMTSFYAYERDPALVKELNGRLLPFHVGWTDYKNREERERLEDEPR